MCLAALGLLGCAHAFPTCGEWGQLSRFGALASHHTGFSCCGAQSSVVGSSWALECRLSSCGVYWLSCSVARGIFSDQGSNPCPLHWQADSYPLSHQGSPKQWIKKKKKLSQILPKIDSYKKVNHCLSEVQMSLGTLSL